MQLKHLLLILIITILFGSAYPVQKVIFNENVPPLLMGSLRMLVVFLCLVPFWKFKIPDKQYWLPLFCFSISMGFLANVFMTLSLNTAKIVSPIIIGSQLAIPFAILLSSFFLKEKVSLKKWLLIFVSFIGIILLGFDPLIRDEIFALILISFMALFYATAQVFSRYLKNLEVTLTNAVMGFIGFIFLIISSSIFEGEVMKEIQNISLQSWLLILHSGIFVSIGAHMSMFYLYRLYPVNKVFPFYALFPVFGVILTFIIFYEIPTLITIVGGLIVIVSTFLINREN
jgi:O-acetylserine/cysteine efflux transporter|tara:strand:- start:2239 stop:3096 length:858 start_codon:yes stop_codon:yes gene_type:complete